MSEKIEENLRKIYRVVAVEPLQIDPLREVVRDIMSQSYIQGSNDHYAAIQAEQAGMDREQAIDLLMLLSALESHLMTHGQRVPDYLTERIAEAVDRLKEEALA